MPTYKLTYFNLRGRAELARLIMTYAGMEYQDVRIEFAQWPEMKPKMLFGGLPILEVDGELFCQSNAINRFLAKKAGLMGDTDTEAGKIDMFNECLIDYGQGIGPIVHSDNEQTKNELKKKFEETLPAQTAKIEKLLKGDHFVGNKMSMADINAAYILSVIRITGINLNLADYPKLKALHDKVFSDPKIAAWIKKRPESSM